MFDFDYYFHLPFPISVFLKFIRRYIYLCSFFLYSLDCENHNWMRAHDRVLSLHSHSESL